MGDVHGGAGNSGLAFPKKDYTGARKQRRAKRVSKGKIDPESKLQKEADKLYKKLGIKSIRISDNIFSFINSCKFLPRWFKIYFNVQLRGWADNILLLKNGRYICIELKNSVGELNPNQKKFREMVGEDNFYKCRTAKEIYEILKKYKVIL